MNATFINPEASISALRAGKGLVPATDDLRRGTTAALGMARAQRLDSTGGLRLLGLRGLVTAALLQAAGSGVVHQDAVGRAADIVGRLGRARASQGKEGRLDSKVLEIRSDRMDAANPSAAIALARELEYVYNELLRDERPVLSARKLFEVDRSVPVGAKTHTIRRIMSAGDAAWYRGGEKIPFVSMGMDEETFPIRHAVIGLEMDLFSQQADAYAGIAEYSEKVRSAMETMEEFVNVAFWEGSDQVKLFGILNYPWLPKKLIATVFDSITTDAQFKAKLDALNGMVNEVLDRNPGMAMTGLRFITSPGMNRYMGQARHPTSQRTLKEVFLAGQPGLEIQEGPELQGAGPGGEDGTLIVPKGTKAPKLVMPSDFTMLPMMTGNYGFSSTQAGYVSLGGVVQRDVLRSLLVWANRTL